jgi:hypothetical protein
MPKLRVIAVSVGIDEIGPFPNALHSRDIGLRNTGVLSKLSGLIQLMHRGIY